MKKKNKENINYNLVIDWLMQHKYDHSLQANSNNGAFFFLKAKDSHNQKLWD